jgi:hypothetical protein
MNKDTYQMTQEEFDQYVEDCIKSEIETFYPEEFERKYGEKSRYHYPKTKIYTYYENINFKQQDELVELWKKSWESNGFEPVVLGLEDAKRSAFYSEFVEKIQLLVLEITGKPISKYGLSCYLRWLAYSTQESTERFLASDYDVINTNFTPVQLIESKEKLCFMDNLCPCLAYGTPEQFLSFCKDIIFRTSKNLERIKLEYVKNNGSCYHDQNFLLLNEQELKDLGVYNICRPRTYVYPYIHNDLKMKEFGIIHFSHNSVNKTKKSFPEFQKINSDELRIKLVKELI